MLVKNLRFVFSFIYDYLQLFYKDQSGRTVSKFNELEPRLKSSKNWFQLKQSCNNEYDFKWNELYLSRGLNLSRGMIYIRYPASSLGMIFVLDIRLQALA